MVLIKYCRRPCDIVSSDDTGLSPHAIMFHSGLSCYSASQHSYDMNWSFTSGESACSFLGSNTTILPLDS